MICCRRHARTVRLLGDECRGILPQRVHLQMTGPATQSERYYKTINRQQSAYPTRSNCNMLPRPSNVPRVLLIKYVKVVVI